MLFDHHYRKGELLVSNRLILPAEHVWFIGSGDAHCMYGCGRLRGTGIYIAARMHKRGPYIADGEAIAGEMAAIDEAHRDGKNTACFIAIAQQYYRNDVSLACILTEDLTGGGRYLTYESGFEYLIREKNAVKEPFFVDPLCPNIGEGKEFQQAEAVITVPRRTARAHIQHSLYTLAKTS
ncbi:hypothetical protein GF342_03170 [Candidatus Woesearchaeota archaeon]|nr:hypothetical protein [Candidatus Woesearchaeota archaeon]